MLKCYVRTAQGHLLTVFDKLLASHLHSIRLIMWRYDQDKKLQSNHEADIFANVRGRISSYALDLMAASLAKLGQRSIPEPCTEFTKRTMGVPCSHVLAAYLADGRHLELTDFEDHWILKQW